MNQVIRTPLMGIRQEETYRAMQQECMTFDDGKVMEYLTFPLLTQTGCVSHLFTTRLGGVSQGIFASCNLSFTRGDAVEAVMENYRRVAVVMTRQEQKLLDKREGKPTPLKEPLTLTDFVCSDQTHTTNIRVATREDAGKGVVRKKDYTDVDGLITQEKGLVLSTFYADCIPLYFVDPQKKAIGLSHSGWRGTVGKMGEQTVKKMQEEFGSRPEEIYAAIGPGICQECYEVSEDVAQAVCECFEKERSIVEKLIYKKDNGKYQLDLWRTNYEILLQAGILPEHIQVTDICTCHNPSYLFSHRASHGRRGNLGAFLCLI